MGHILNILPPIDSLVRPDTLTSVQAGIAAVVEKVVTTPADELLKDMIDSSVRFGLKVLAALAIYFAGACIAGMARAVSGTHT